MNAPLQPTPADAWIDSSVRDAHPDHVAILIAESGLAPGETSQHSEADE